MLHIRRKRKEHTIDVEALRCVEFKLIIEFIVLIAFRVVRI